LETPVYFLAIYSECYRLQDWISCWCFW